MTSSERSIGLGGGLVDLSSFSRIILCINGLVRRSKSPTSLNLLECGDSVDLSSATSFCIGGLLNLGMTLVVGCCSVPVDPRISC